MSLHCHSKSAVNLFTQCVPTSLITRPSHRPVFDCLQKRRGRPGPFYHVNDVCGDLGRHRGEGSSIERTHFAHFDTELSETSVHKLQL